MRKTVVIWTRFSSEMQRTESCADQERMVRDGLTTRGIDHAHARVFKVEAVSGTRSDATQFVELMGMIRKEEVGLLGVDDQSRFSRGDQAFSIIQDLVFSGGRFISTGENIDTDEPGWELKVKVLELHHSTTIRELGRRVRRGQEGRVLDGNGSAGDFGYGYRAEFVDPNYATWNGRGPKPKKIVVIYDPEAEVVRAIFIWFVGGMSICAITRKLNELGIPKGHRCSRPGWHHQIVRRILSNAKYIGQWTWGRTRTLRDSRGRKRQVPVENSAVVKQDRPDLRIIDDVTWAKAQTRLRQLHEIYGKKPHQESRAAKVHHTELYPAGLLNGLIFCASCGARLVIQQTTGRKYLGCPNHRRGTCAMVARVPAERAEKMLVNILGRALVPDAEWLRAATDAMRKTLADLSAAVPEALAAEKKRLEETEKAIANLVDAIAAGLERSEAIRAKLTTLEDLAVELRERVDRQCRLLAQPMELPDDASITKPLGDLVALLKEDLPAAAILLRKLLGKVVANEVKIRGKKRGYVQLRFRIDAFETLAAALDDRFPAGVMTTVSAGPDVSPIRSPEFTLDLGKLSRMDRWAPKIVELREQGVPWKEIGRITGLSIGNAWAAWRRWTTDDGDDIAAA